MKMYKFTSRHINNRKTFSVENTDIRAMFFGIAKIEGENNDNIIYGEFDYQPTKFCFQYAPDLPKDENDERYLFDDSWIFDLTEDGLQDFVNQIDRQFDPYFDCNLEITK